MSVTFKRANKLDMAKNNPASMKRPKREKPVRREPPQVVRFINARSQRTWERAAPERRVKFAKQEITLPPKQGKAHRSVIENLNLISIKVADGVEVLSTTYRTPRVNKSKAPQRAIDKLWQELAKVA